MSQTTRIRITAASLIVIPVAFTILFTLLQAGFEYPGILRQPAGYVLGRLHQGGGTLVGLWYGMMISAALFIPIAWMVRHLWERESSPWLGLATVFGVVAGLVQVLGFARWVFLAPSLAQRYVDPASSDATREAVAVVFAAFNQYAGVGVGEHLGYLFTALWTAMISWQLLQRSTWLGRTGMLFAAGIACGLLEPFGVSSAGVINAVSYLLWSGWLVAFGIILLRTGLGLSEPSLRQPG